MLHSLIYTSRAVHPPGDVTNLDILRTAEKNNKVLELTGFLLRFPQNFLQYLEGPESALELMLERLKKDQRHFEVCPLAFGMMRQRQYPDWAMRYGEGSEELNAQVSLALSLDRSAPESAAAIEQIAQLA